MVRRTIAICLLSIASLSFAQQAPSKIEETRDWYQDSKFGMFIHFDVRRPRSEWHPKNLDTDEWVRIAKNAGMKYIVPTTHQSSYIVMWKSDKTDQDVTDLTAFKQDYLKELGDSAKSAGLRMGAYYAIADPGNPLYSEEKGSDISAYVTYLHSIIKELVEKYEPVLIWFDASRRFRAAEAKPFLRQQDMVDMLHSYGTMSNSRLGDDDALQYVDYLTMNDNLAPNFNLGVYWESAVTITLDGSWHYTKKNAELRSTKDLLHRLVNATGNGGNLLLNVGPDRDGVIPKNMEDRLQDMGNWISKNSEAIYATQAGPYPHQIPWGTITQRQQGENTALYLNVVDWPKTGDFTLYGLKNKVLSAELLVSSKTINVTQSKGFTGNNTVTLDIPVIQPDEHITVIKLVVAGKAEMDHDFIQQTDGSIIMDAYNARIHDIENIPGKATTAAAMNMVTVPQLGKGIMPLRGLAVSGFDKKGLALSWDIEVHLPGTYDVIVTSQIREELTWKANGKVRVNVAGQSVVNELADHYRIKDITMNHFKDIYSRIGTITINQPIADTLTLEVASDFTDSKPKIRGVKLIKKDWYV